MEVFRCKLNKCSLVSRLKCRIVFCGDLYCPDQPRGAWNPHAAWVSLILYMGTCARLNIFPTQCDFIMPCIQRTIHSECLSDRLPSFGTQHVSDLKLYMGTPLHLLKALNGYMYSGKLLWEDQAPF